MKINIVWLRRDLRLEDNVAIHEASKDGLKVVLLFIFDRDILDDLPQDDARVYFFFKQLRSLNTELQKTGSSVLTKYGRPFDIWEQLLTEFDIHKVYFNKDYEPYAFKRDKAIVKFLNEKNIGIETFKDHVIFEPGEVMKKDGTPYTVFTPFKRKWLEKYQNTNTSGFTSPPSSCWLKKDFPFPSPEDIGLKKSPIEVPPYDLRKIMDYDRKRDIPAVEGTTLLGPHLRFGTVSIRKMAAQALKENATFLSELIWREFFIQIMYFFPYVITHSFRPKYDNIKWINDPNDFEAWCKGNTGYPLVDAGMKQLNKTGYMHNRVRMITAGFLCKHLLIDWRWGESYFANKLLDYELASNNGNWQWAAGTGCDAAPYFRVFNPTTQLKKFDPQFEYVRKWIPGFNPSSYIDPIVDHSFARQRAINTYKAGIENYPS